MEKIYIENLHHYLNEEVVTYFLVTQKELRDGKKDQYIRLRLTDKTGNIAANIWNNVKQLKDLFKEGDIVKIKGIVISYREQSQITVNNVRRAREDEYDIAEFVPKTSKDVKELSDALFHYIDNINDEYIKQLLESIFGNKEFFSKFSQAPAAKSWHHNYMGGLIEHTVSVTKICDFASHMYPVQKDILIAGAMLHDAGKVYEYSMRPAIDFTPIGRLVGHICLADEMVTKKAAEINNFPDNTLLKIRHLILSHHGEFEKGSCRLPQMLEAIVLHFADNLDAQTIGVNQLVEAGLKSDSEWTEFDRLNNRYFYIG